MTGCYVSESCSHNNRSGRFRSASIPHAGSIAQSDDFLSSFLLNGRNAGASSVSTRISPYSSISGSCFRFLCWDSSMLVYLLARRILGKVLARVIHQDAARVLAATCMSLHPHLLILTNTNLLCLLRRQTSLQIQIRLAVEGG